MSEIKPLVEAKGVNGQIRLYDDRVTLTHKGALGFLTQGHKGEKTVFIRQISSVQFKNAGLATNGYIQLAFLGGQETKGGLFNATKDENTVMFNRGQRKEFEHLRDEIMTRIATAGMAVQTSASPSMAEELGKLAALRDQGILTSAEFETQKQRLLADH